MDLIKEFWKEVVGFSLFIFTSIASGLIWLLHLQSRVEQNTKEVHDLKNDVEKAIGKLEQRIEKQLDTISNDIKTLLRGHHD